MVNVIYFATQPPNIRLQRRDQSVVRSVSTEETIKSFNLRLWPTPNTISAGTDHFWLRKQPNKS